ncbi:MAG: glucokinase [Trichodesmium sp. St16_bin4-tuft]|nr:glucokinase [Trichodesmium sp. St5_bin8]MDE5078032.1 glucokinase [Trichodesmium sp. St2_bin6]MDE5090320.1 glucokinase [Trichodesmium sp. St18_bin3_1_1]MDE5098025.1 glucokinase [Trichodesmium sp. St16_bin4-tuft]MDE5102404.1 glucokinase [Trichodesmium sp. St19_bin2]
MTLLVAGDIGGTKTILQLVEVNREESKTSVELRKLYENRYLSNDFPDLVPIVKKFLEEASEKLGEKQKPEKACFAIAGPVVNNIVKLTNLPWIIDAKLMENELGISQISLINDFEAVGYGILGLNAKDLKTLQPGEPKSDTPIAVIGAGTGLGQCFLIRAAGVVKVYPTEGGHTDFKARSQLEFDLLKYLKKLHNIKRVSVERVVSGMGIVAIYQFLRDSLFATESREIGELIRQWEKEVGSNQITVDPGAVIGKAALEKSDPLCEQTLKMFIEAYGAEAGNLALKLLPYSGLYIAGGIAAKIIPLINSGSFMEAFKDKGRMKPLLEKIPVHVILNPHVGLIGAAIRASNL